MNKTTFFLAILLSAFVLGACDDDGTQREQDERLIQDYIAANELEAQSTETGLYYVIDVPGSEEKPEFGDVIDIIYTGRFLDEEIFDTTNGIVVTFQLKNLIQGWLEGIPLYGKGGKGMLLIPSHLAYGPTGSQSGTIRPNTVILFDIELEDFE